MFLGSKFYNNFKSVKIFELRPRNRMKMPVLRYSRAGKPVSYEITLISHLPGLELLPVPPLYPKIMTKIYYPGLGLLPVPPLYPKQWKISILSDKYEENQQFDLRINILETEADEITSWIVHDPKTVTTNRQSDLHYSFAFFWSSPILHDFDYWETPFIIVSPNKMTLICLVHLISQLRRFPPPMNHFPNGEAGRRVPKKIESN